MLYSIIAAKLVKVAKNCGAIQAADEAVYQYAFESLVGHICSFATMFAIAFLCRIPQYILLYIVLMYPLRTYSGGFHAATPGKCYLISTGMFVGMIACEQWVSKHLSMEFLIVSLFICSVVVFALAPVESENKPLEEREVKRYRRISRILMIVEMLLILVMQLLHLSRSVYYALSAPITVAILLTLPYIGKRFHSIRNRQENRKTEK